jgi:hypothetical protein
MKLSRKTPVLVVTVLLFPMAAAGQDKDASTEANSDNEAFENIVVASQKSPGDLRRDLWRAEKEFYSMYNKLNDDGLYDVRCTIEVPTGSMIKSQVCRPKFLDRAIKDGKVRNATSLESNPEIAANIVTFRNNLETLVAENPDLQTAAAALNLAHARVEADSAGRADN